MDDAAQARRRIDAGRGAIGRLPAAQGSPLAIALHEVVEAPTSAPGIALCHPASLDADELAGGAVTITADTDATIAVVVLDVPAVGDVLRTVLIDGRWVALRGTRGTCGTVPLPSSELLLTLSWPAFEWIDSYTARDVSHTLEVPLAYLQVDPARVVVQAGLDPSIWGYRSRSGRYWVSGVVTPPLDFAPTLNPYQCYTGRPWRFVLIEFASGPGACTIELLGFAYEAQGVGYAAALAADLPPSPLWIDSNAGVILSPDEPLAYGWSNGLVSHPVTLYRGPYYLYYPVTGGFLDGYAGMSLTEATASPLYLAWDGLTGDAPNGHPGPPFLTSDYLATLQWFRRAVVTEPPPPPVEPPLGPPEGPPGDPGGDVP